MSLSVSVIIPVLNNTEGLRLCLLALAPQLSSFESGEIIVVDNAPVENAGIKELAASFIRVKHLHEPRPGSYSARNRGLSVATGEIVAFTDSDCIPAPDWLARGVSHFRNNGLDLMLAGRIDVFCRDRARPTAAELHELVFAFPQKFFIEKMRFAATANMWTSRRSLDRVGPFPRSFFSGGDRSWGEAAFAKGVRQAFAEDVIVRHPARYSFAGMALMYTRIVKGDRDRRLAAGRAGILAIIDPALYSGILLRQSVRAWQTGRLHSFRERLLVSGAAWAVWAIRVKEWFKLILGRNNDG